MAGRNKDEEDIIALAKILQISKRKDVITLVTQYVPKDDITIDVVRGIERCFNL